MKKSVLLLCTLLAACTNSKYIGENFSSHTQYSCPIKQKVCGGEDKNIKIRYEVKTLSRNQYLITGFFHVINKRYYRNYDDVEDVDMFLLFGNKGNIVHKEQFRLQGSVEDKIMFEREFSSTEAIDASTLIDISYRLVGF